MQHHPCFYTIAAYLQMPWYTTVHRQGRAQTAYLQRAHDTLSTERAQSEEEHRVVAPALWAPFDFSMSLSVATAAWLPVLPGCGVHYVHPECEDDLGLAHGIKPNSLRQALEAVALSDQQVGAVLIVSPTYFGACSDIPGLCPVSLYVEPPVTCASSASTVLQLQWQLQW